MQDLFKQITETVTDIKTLIGAAVSLAVAAFTVGVVYNDLSTHISALEKDLKTAQGQISKIEQENGKRKSEIETEASRLDKLKADLNIQFGRLRADEVENYKGVIQNTAGPNGAGNSPEQGPGHCADGAFVVGIQPQAGTINGINFQCAKLPVLMVK